ncbi:DUF4209 domain-containing protein [Rhizobium leguminosarum]|uniref:DUF4209 domain-containing protein n=1 Tax=Rhizobium leguminosarum TaxID=384 RepID=UPI001C949FFF|nr:DUF4209 domain-containing protein [Rhizobium leguminosarum]MBY5663902.1 DUF4209 domain-containing protein [Rhizobium leguminosarum]MBY5677425.1 DUF4209 domain-containing protein [Rhizobium leguminosarum]
MAEETNNGPIEGPGHSHLLVPEGIEATIQEFDSSSAATTTHAVQARLGEARTKLREKTALSDGYADFVAFAFQEGSANQGPWQTYFGPMSIRQLQDGSFVYGPDPRQLTSEIVDHWAGRANNLKNPVLKARYADLVWELGGKVDRRTRDVAFARLAIDAYIGACASMMLPERFDAIAAACRATDLAISIGDKTRGSECRRVLLQLFHDGVNARRHWHRAYERLTANKKVGLNENEREGLIEALETLFSTTGVESETFDPWELKSIADYLIPHYRRAGSKADVQRLASGVSKAFESISAKAAGLQAISWLEDAVEYAEIANDQDGVARLRIEREKAVTRSNAEMKPISWTTKISMDDVDTFVATIVKDDATQSLARIAMEFVPRVKQHREYLKKSSPLYSMINMHILADDHVAAKVGGIEEDPDGRLFHNAQLITQTDVFWLDQLLEKVVDQYDLDAGEIAACASRGGLFPDTMLIREGIDAWMKGDYLKTVFILTPQVEAALREFVRGLGRPVNKDHPVMQGRQIPLNIGDMLGDEIVKEALGEDLVFYFRLVFSDPRGRNLRNRVAHGQMGYSAISYGVGNVLIHAILVLAFLPEIRDALVEKSRPCETTGPAGTAGGVDQDETVEAFVGDDHRYLRRPEMKPKNSSK